MRELYLGYTEVSDLRYSNAEGTKIDCIVKFDHIGEPVPFTADRDDSNLHSRSIFEYAVEEGHVFGQIAPFVPRETPQEDEDEKPLTKREARALEARLADLEGGAVKPQSGR